MTDFKWNPAMRVKFRDGADGEYLGLCRLTGKRRVHSLAADRTVWLLDDEGKCREDGAPSAHDRVE